MSGFDCGKKRGGDGGTFGKPRRERKEKEKRVGYAEKGLRRRRSRKGWETDPSPPFNGEPPAALKKGEGGSEEEKP